MRVVAFLLFSAVAHAEITNSTYESALQRASEHSQRGEYAEASATLTETLALAQRNHQAQWVAVLRTNLGNTYLHAGRYAEAEIALTNSVAWSLQHGGTDAADVASALDNLGSLYYEAGQLAHAGKLLRQALDVLKQNGAKGEPLGIVLNNLGAVYLAERKDDLAKQAALEALAIWESAKKTEGAGAATSWSVLGLASKHLGSAADAGIYLRRSIAIMETAFGDDDLRTAQSRAQLGFLYLDQGKLRQATPLFERANIVFGRNQLHDAFTLRFLGEYARLQRKRGQRQAARVIEKQLEELNTLSAAAVVGRNVVDVSELRAGRRP